ncbi:MAG: formylglycine-generating enzyme family protein [Holophagales bacterium]|nr:formylglycine-generating enzyme family protein [Holophagales bacterium]
MTRYRPHPLQDHNIPSWAWGFGSDRRGVFVEIKLGKVIQRMRWIPPGRFWMGSPEGEVGRADWEGPRHPVVLTEGFWLGETPVTQALWTVVMGENPSRFRSLDRPVERVSWEDCQRFLEVAEQRQPGLELRLPTEAQWERACRAETIGATWLGDLEILGENNAPLLDEIAWYGGNSGEGFDLEEGVDSSDWREKQYAHEKAGTRRVRKKRPNPWGLCDMLGNVWEWCSDHGSIGEGYPGSEERVDPESKEGPHRVIRGGSWSSFARYVRAAYRGWDAPGARDGRLGFRLSRGP